MKAKDIKEFELGNHCYGKIMRVNGKEFEDISKEDAMEFINDMINNDINSSSIVEEIFERLLEYLPYDITENTSHRCDQCGDYNTYAKYKVIKE